jgi:glucokinase
MPRLAIALDLGGSQVRAALVGSDGTIHQRFSEPTKADGSAEAVIAQLAHAARMVSREARDGALPGVGLSSPGPLDTESGMALGLPTIKAFMDVPIRALLEAELGQAVHIENDAIAAALGEWRFGAGKGLRHLVYVTVSTGIGGGVVADGRLLRGRRGLACHIGHMSIVKDGAQCPCGARGCWEAYAAGSAFAARAAERFAERSSPAEVFAAARRGDRVAQSLVDEEADYLGCGIVSLLHLFSPERIIMGGGMSRDLDRLLPGIEAVVLREAMPAYRDVPIVAAGLGSNSGLLGAAALVFESTP